MNTSLRSEVQDTAAQGVKIIRDYLSGGAMDKERVTTAMKALGFGVKIEHMNQIKDHGDKSLALRLLQFLPKDDSTRTEYLKITNPQITHLLISRPTKKLEDRRGRK